MGLLYIFFSDYSDEYNDDVFLTNNILGYRKFER